MAGAKAKFVKARYDGSKRSYCFLTQEDLQPGDRAATESGVEVTVVDEPTDLSWVETYGKKNIKWLTRASSEPQCSGCRTCSKVTTK